MQFTLIALAFGGGLFAGMLLFQELGRRIGARQLERDPSGARAGVGILEGAVFGLLALLLAFTFSAAATRFDGRRQLISDEVNAIGTAWLRVDLLPAEPQPAIRDGFRRYLDSSWSGSRRRPRSPCMSSSISSTHVWDSSGSTRSIRHWLRCARP